MKNPMPIEVVLFDLGGVLIELTGMPVLLNWTNLDETEIWGIWLQSPAVRKFESGQGDAEEFAREITAELELSVSPAEFMDNFRQWPKGVFPEGIKLLQSLKDNGHRIACLSNTNHLHWQRFTTESPLLDFFDPALASHLTGLLKPDSSTFDAATRSIGVTAEQILFLDDNQINTDAALKSGMQAELTRGIAQASHHLRTYGLLQSVDG